MSRSLDLWLLYQDSRTWRCRPSDLLGVEDQYAAYCLDQATAVWGRHIEHELEEASENAKDKNAAVRARKAVLYQYFPELEDAEPQIGSYADPAAMFG